MVVEVDGGLDAADLGNVLRKAARDARCILISGDLSADIGVDTGWIALLADMPAMPVVAAQGPVGLRGLALLLLADLAFIGPDAGWAGPDHAGLAELAVIRLGPMAARRLAMAADPVAALVAAGHIEHAGDPLGTARSRAEAMTGTAHRLRQGWRAARDLPCDEALVYGGWFNTIDTKEGT